jgi:sugar/nucleoside kinase (ribokinase family)
MSLLVVGTLAYDSVKTPFGERENILGGSASYAATCASYFGSVRIVGIVGEDFRAEDLAFFAQRGIDTRGIERAQGRTFRWQGVYEENMNIRHTLDTQLNVLEAFSPVLPEGYRDSPYLVLGNIDPKLQLSVLEQLRQPKLVACDTMNFWIEGYREALDRTLARVDLLLINDSEALQLSGEHNLLKAARAVRTMGPSSLVIKLGEHGAVLFDEHGTFITPALLLDRILDPTGAGDSFAGGMMGYLASLNRHDAMSVRQAMIIGTVMASFSVQGFSIDGIRQLEDGALRARLDQYSALTQIDLPTMVSSSTAP